jgi:large subunit ribosomal protein L21
LTEKREWDSIVKDYENTKIAKLRKFVYSQRFVIRFPFMFAVIKTGGKQYLVKEGSVLKIEKLGKKPGEKLEFEAMLVFDDTGKEVKVGKPVVEGAKVSAEVLEEARGDKISVIKFKRKVRYKKNVGHRQWFTKVKIRKISAK